MPQSSEPEDRSDRRWRELTSWLLPPIISVALYWRGLAAWFRTDDFSWLQFHRDNLIAALLAPSGEGTLRPLSERIFFLAGWRMFGLHAWPFHAIAFATHFANLALVAAIGHRLTGSRAAGFCAALFFTVNSALSIPL